MDTAPSVLEEEAIGLRRRVKQLHDDLVNVRMDREQDRMRAERRVEYYQERYEAAREELARERRTLVENGIRSHTEAVARVIAAEKTIAALFKAEGRSSSISQSNGEDA